MHTLHVRSVPENIYEDLRSLAQQQQRSLSAQVILMLERALIEERQRSEQTQILAEIRRRRFIPAADAPDSVELLRQDRER